MHPDTAAVEGEIWPELEVVNPNSEENKKYKSSGSIAQPNLENINGNISKPTSKIDVLKLKDLNK